MWRRSRGGAACFMDAVVDDVLDENGDEGLDADVVELAGRFVAPTCDLGVPLGIVATLVLRKLLRDTRNGPRRCPSAPTRTDGAVRYGVQRSAGLFFVGHRRDDTQHQMVPVLADHDHRGRLVAVEAQKFDRLPLGGRDLGRCVGPAVVAVAYKGDRSHRIMHGGK